MDNQKVDKLFEAIEPIKIFNEERHNLRNPLNLRNTNKNASFH